MFQLKIEACTKDVVNPALVQANHRYDNMRTNSNRSECCWKNGLVTATSH